MSRSYRTALQLAIPDVYLGRFTPKRRFPPPWSAEVTPNCFIVRDANGQALSYIYYESEPGRRSAAKLLSKDEARHIAANKLGCGSL
jgi:hypothetical protein